MSRITLGSNDLLEYDPKHKVLICRDCEYAIQKSAVRSHLLRHKIYRGERQNLLSTIATFDLCEPDEVLLPDPQTLPIATLPVLNGYRCKHSDCTNLCASVKRMKRHWTDVHGRTTQLHTTARQVKMQTFFRGTKIRYFEVREPSGIRSRKTTPLAATTPEALEPTVQLLDQEETVEAKESSDESEELVSNSDDSDEVLSDLDEDSDNDEDEQAEDAENIIPDPKSALNARDLETLRTFHHFLSSTSRSLPGPHYKMNEERYWSTVVLPLALSRHWLMSGLLAVSAYHASTLTSTASLAEAYRSQALSFFANFVAGREEASRHKYEDTITPDKDDERRIGGQLMCILRCALWALTPNPLLGQRFLSHPFNLHNFIIMIRSFTLMERFESDETTEDVFARASGIPQMRYEEECTAEDGALPGLLDTLPSRMSDVLGRPNSVRDAMATLAAIASLAEHYRGSFEVEGGVPLPSAVWHGMVQWWSRIPDHFRYLVSRHDPFALVIVAYWVSAFVFRAEKSGFWFLSGFADELHLEIDVHLRSSCAHASTLIVDVISERVRGPLTT